MRRFYIHLQKSNFAVDGNIWSSEIIDLYDNDSYTNFSTVKSIYGSGLVGNDVWTGVEALGATPKLGEGFAIDGRYIDYTGQIDIVNFVIPDEYVVLSGTGSVSASITVYTSQDSDASFPDEWTSFTSSSQYADFNILDSFRYIKLKIVFSGPIGIVVEDANVYGRIEIGSPNINPFFARSKAILDKFPSWMDIREIDTEVVTERKYLQNPNSSVTSYSSTPRSLGGNFINSAFGEWIEELDQSINKLELQRYIGTADTRVMAWCYKVEGVPEYLHNVTGDGIRLGCAVDLDEFYNVEANEHIYWWNEVSNSIYTNNLYQELKVNGNVVTQSLFQVWNHFDDFGLLVDLQRLRSESNENFKLRILDVYQNKPGASIENFKLALRRELDLWRVYNSTPNSDFAGATPEILEISDLENNLDYIDKEGLATEKFQHLINWLSYEYPTTWGRFFFEESIWDVAGTDYEGYSLLPLKLDATPVSDQNAQSGVGDGNDLLLYRPEAFLAPHDFNARLKARGRRKIHRSESREIELAFELYGQADRKVYNNPTIYPWFTLEIVRTDAGSTPSNASTYFYSFQVKAKSNIDVNKATNTSYSELVFVTEGDQTNPEINWAKKSDGTYYQDGSATPITPLGAMKLEQISTVTLRHGKWDVTSQSYINKEVSDIFSAWFSHDSATKIIYNTSSNYPSMTGGTNSPRSHVVVQSNLSSYTVGKWKSPKVPLVATINGKLPDYSPLSNVIPVPEIPWDNYLESTPNKEIVIELIARSTSNKYGGTTHDVDGNTYFLDSSYFSVNGNSTWTDGYKKTLSATGLNNLIFASNNGPLYPVPGYYWEYVEYNQIGSFSGTVNQYGPYANGSAPGEGNSDFVFTRQFIDRSDFGIPNSSDYIITWMGIECTDDKNVIVWLDSNTVNPAVEDPNVNVDYPENAIVETLDGGVYNFGDIAMYARLRPDPSPQWNPHINSGYFYDKNQEYYLYANPVRESFASHASPSLAYVSRQGAPIIVTTDASPQRQLRQVWFFDEDASPVSLSLTNKQIISPATPTNDIYLAYNDIYNVSIANATTGEHLNGIYSSSTNHIKINQYLNPDETYLVTYKLNGSFYADNNYMSGSTPSTRLYFDKLPSNFGATKFIVNYESSILHPATPISLDLSPLYTTFEEGFVFISFNEYDLSRIEVRISPSAIVSNGKDYLMITIRSLDQYDNPKPNQTFNITSTWGTISQTPIKTDKDGFAVTYLNASATSATFSGNITVSGDASATVRFDIIPAATPSYSLHAMPKSEMIPADGTAKNYVVGSVRNVTHQSVPYAYVNWGRSRSVSDLFTSPPKYSGGSGLTVADASGNFSIGPFTAATPEEPGYWFMSAYSSSASPTGTWTETGDVVFWYEYPDIRHGVESMSGLPIQAMQHATPARHATPMFNAPQYPVDLSPSANIISSTPPTKYWLPKAWVPISWYYLKEVGYWGQLDVGATPSDTYYANMINLNRWTIGY